MAPPTQDQSLVSLPITRAPLPLIRPEIATLAMQRFQCTGGDCPDTCCKDFGVSFDQASMKRMLAATAHSPADRERVVRLVVLNHPATGSGQSMVTLNEQGACPMLETSGQCELHRKFGEASLGTACSIFPRTSLKIDERLEVSGTLACPELARLTLLAEDGVNQAESPSLLLPREYIGKTIANSAEGAEPFAANFELVRAALRDLFCLRGFPLSSRLVFGAQLATQVDDFFHQGTNAFHGKQQRFTQQRLLTELSLAKDLATLKQLHNDLRDFPGNHSAVVGTVLSLLRQRLGLPHPPRFADALAGLAATEESDDTTLILRLSDLDVRLTERLPGIVDRILARYAQHYLLRHPYTDSPNLSVYLGRMSLSLATIKTMTLGSPSVAALLADPGNPRDDGNALAQTVVEAAQIFTKAVSHQTSFLTNFHTAFESGRGTTFGRLALFARYLA